MLIRYETSQLTSNNKGDTAAIMGNGNESVRREGIKETKKSNNPDQILEAIESLSLNSSFL